MVMKGVLFDEKHSYTDFGLVLNSKEIGLPEPKTYIIDVPCADGSLDLSTALTGGEIKYKNRLIKLNFTVLKPWNQLEILRSTIANHLHGKIMKVIFDADYDFFYTGRCRITSFNTSVIPATVTIEMDAEPYKYDIHETVIFETVSGSKTIYVDDQTMKVVPTITVSSDMTLTYKTKMYQLFSGENIIPEIMLSSMEDNELVFSGNGDVTITFRGGEL
jgi:hypothetical protein